MIYSAEADVSPDFLGREAVQAELLVCFGCRQYVTACAMEEEGSKKCPDAWSLTTTDDLRTHLSVFDIIPSAVDGHRGNESAMFLNHDLLGMFRAMAAHKSQSRWCASYLFEKHRDFYHYKDKCS